MIEPRRSREIEELVQTFIRELTEAVESATEARARVLGEEYLRAAAPLARRPEARARPVAKRASPAGMAEPVLVEPTGKVQPDPPRAAQVRPKRERPAPSSKAQPVPAIDPEGERRAAELARLRAILRPTAPVPTAPPVMAPPPQRLPEEADTLQALEDRIRDRIPGLAGLSQRRYTAQIAAWVGRVRSHQSGPDSERTRIASRMLFEKLRNLAWSMEAGTIEALNASWSTRNWEQYIHDNEFIAATEDPPPPSRPGDAADEDIWSTPSEVGEV